MSKIGEHYKKQVITKVKEQLHYDPFFAKELLDITTENLQNFRNACITERNGVAKQALHMTLGLFMEVKQFHKVTSTKLMRKYAISLLDAIVYMYPNGYDSVGCIFDKNLLNNFCRFFFHETVALHKDKVWLEIKGAEVQRVVNLLQKQMDEYGLNKV